MIFSCSAGSLRSIASWPRSHVENPCISEIKRFGEYATDGLTVPPAAFDARLNLRQDATDQTTRVAAQAA